MGKKFSKRVTRRTKVKLSPREADEIIRQEFIDDRGNRFIFKIDVKPHSPMTPTIEGTVKYKDNE